MKTYRMRDNNPEQIEERERRGDKTPIAEGRSVFETPEQRRRRMIRQYLKNTDKVLRPKKPKKA
jgi:hypothetical protein